MIDSTSIHSNRLNQSEAKRDEWVRGGEKKEEKQKRITTSRSSCIFSARDHNVIFNFGWCRSFVNESQYPQSVNLVAKE